MDKLAIFIKGKKKRKQELKQQQQQQQQKENKHWSRNLKAINNDNADHHRN